MNKSTTSNQVISLPRGGGALHGIGESFAPDLHTGTGNFTVPIALPAGRNQFQPQLNLVYSTGLGNGPFGLGWSLSIPGVSRKTSKGIPRYADERAPLPEQDVFLLSGAEDLVAVAETAGVTRYRPRTEGLFARIEHHADTQTDHWEVRSKDGLVSVYGTPLGGANDPAVVANPENRRQIFDWKLTETTDPFGNAIRYEYQRESGDTADHLWDQLYLERIQYADYDDPETGKQRSSISVTFNYEERPDPFSDYRPGFEIRTTRRCTTIEVRTHFDVERLVRTYRLIYLDRRGLPIEQLPLNAASLLSQVVVEGQDGESRESMPPLTFGYTAFEPTRRRYQPFTGAAGARPERSLGHPEYELVDVFGNGLPTVVEFDDQVRFWRNRGDGRFDLLRTMERAPAGVRLSERGVQLLDANGNGRADLMVIEGVRNGYYPLTFDGQWDERGFVPYRAVPAVDLHAPDVRFMDLDGDGVTDALRTGRQFELYYNDRTDGWVDVDVRERIASDSFPDVTFEDPRVKLGDMTGDGLHDILLIHDGRIEYWPYRGYGRWGRRVTMRNSPRFEDAEFFSGIGFDPKRLLIGDVDGDGVADLVGDLSAEGNTASFKLKPGNYVVEFAAVRRLNGRVYSTQRYFNSAVPIPLRGLSLSTNRTFDVNGSETNGTGTPPLPVRNALAKRLFDKGAISAEDDWIFELIPEEMLGVPAGTAIGGEELDLSDVQDVALLMEYDVTPAAVAAISDAPHARLLSAALASSPGALVT